jgi:hypothetical protein
MGFVQFFLAGGVPMLFVVVLGLLAVAAAVPYARRPGNKPLGVVRALTVATAFSVLCATWSDLCAVFTKVPAHPEWVAESGLASVVMTGLGESLTPGVVGFALLSAAWLLVAVGARRVEG